MKLLKYLALIIILWAIPSFFSYDEGIGSKFVLLMIGCLLLYFFIGKKRKIMLPFIILGLLYFTISGLILIEGNVKYYINDLIKYFIVIICGTELARDTSKKELFIILMFGTSSILFHAIFFQGDFGRYSGFYLDPNGAGFACAIAYSLSFKIQPNILKVFGQFLITFSGLLTFSRTFIILWLLISVISVISNRKNFLNFGLGIGALIVIFTVGSLLKVDTVRFNALENIFEDDNKASVSVIKSDSRTKTWSKYYTDILNNPFFGNGYKQLSGINKQKQGVHNTYLMVLGESGIFPFLLFVGIYLFLLVKSFPSYKTNEYKPMLSVTLILLLMTTHNYFDNFFLIFISLWLLVHTTENHFEDELAIKDQELKILKTTI